MKLLRTVLTSCILCIPVISHAKEEHKEDSKPHCEKIKDGKSIHFHEAKTRRECKKKGGRWVKGHKKDHGDHSGHDHKKGGHDDHDHKKGSHDH